MSEAAYTNENRTLHVEGLVNARDLGGLKRQDGSHTPYGVFYRSESVDLILGDGWNQLYDEGIRTIVDLRQHEERETDTVTRPEWLRTIHVDLDGVEHKEFWQPYLEEGLESTSMYYLEHLRQLPQQASKALDALVSAPEGGVLFHCKSGRDRTGLIALLLLAAVDTEPEEIVDDYLETVRRGEIRGQRLGRDNPEPGLDHLLQRHGTSTEASFRNAVQELEVSDFLANTDLSELSIQALTTWRGAIK